MFFAHMPEDIHGSSAGVARSEHTRVQARHADCARMGILCSHLISSPTSQRTWWVFCRRRALGAHEGAGTSCRLCKDGHLVQPSRSCACLCGWCRSINCTGARHRRMPHEEVGAPIARVQVHKCIPHEEVSFCCLEKRSEVCLEGLLKRASCAWNLATQAIHAQMRGMRVQVHRHKPVKVFCFLVERFIASKRGLKYASRGS